MIVYQQRLMWINGSLPFCIAKMFLRWKQRQWHGLLCFSTSWGHVPCTSLLNTCLFQNLGSSLGPPLLWTPCVFELLKWMWKAFGVCRWDLGAPLLIYLIACSRKATVYNETSGLWLLLLKHHSEVSSFSIVRKTVKLKNGVRMESNPSRCLWLVLLLLLVYLTSTFVSAWMASE